LKNSNLLLLKYLITIINNTGGIMEGIIVKGVAGQYNVRTDSGTVVCKARGKFRHDGLTPMVGDKVKISVQNNEGVIEIIHDRTTELIRPVVANVTQAFVVFALKNPDINLDLLYKFLVLCEYNNLKIVVCFNKLDLASEEDASIVNIIKKAGYDTITLKAKEGYGLDILKTKIKGNISVFCGPSGVGKSTILNSLAGKKLMETGDISKKLKKGKHTTRHSELIEYADGFLVDTPGFSSLEMSFIEEEELQACFPDFEYYIGECKFANCLHYKEPGCNIKKAVEEGKIDKGRYDFYINTLEELKDRRNKKW
jgi:ribosome biogenesis GTPase